MGERHFNDLTPAEAERLALLAEECAEVIQVVGKILRHGYESTNPKKRSGETNRMLLEKELGDASLAVTLMIEAHDIDAHELNRHREEKRKRVRKYLHHQDKP